MVLTRDTDGAKQSQDDKTSHDENIQGDLISCVSFIYSLPLTCVSMSDASLSEFI